MRCKNCLICIRKPSKRMKKTGFCRVCLPKIEDFIGGDEKAIEKLNELENKYITKKITYSQ